MGKFKRAAAKRRRQATRVNHTFTPAPGVVRAKVGAITYEGHVFADTFHYTTRAGDAKRAHKFTVLG